MGGGPCDFGVNPSPFALDFGTLDFGTSDSGLTIKFYIFPLVTPPCKAAPPVAWLGWLLELNSLSKLSSQMPQQTCKKEGLIRHFIVIVDSPTLH